MNKVFHVAVREFEATVMTKGFLIGILIMPVLIVAMVFGMGLLFNEKPPRIEGEVAVIDPTGQIYPGLKEYLAPAALVARRDDFRAKTEELAPPGLARIAEAAGRDDVRQQALDALLGEVPRLDVVELDRDTDPEEAKQPLRGGAAKDGGRLALIAVHEDAVVRAGGEEKHGSYKLFVREKLDDRIAGEIRSGMRESIVDARIREAGLDPDFIDSLTRVGRVGSKTVSETGEKETNEVLNAVMPAALMLLLFASVLTGAQSLMTTTVEEKSSRVVELLLSAVSPAQLMAGKIIGQMGVGLLLLAVYAGMGVATMASFALIGLLDPILLVYLVIFYLIAYLVIASLLAAIGAAVNEMREAQSLMGPVMILLMAPWILWMPISRNPDSAFAVAASMLPPINSFVMLIRLASTSPPPWWQVWLSIGIGLASVGAAIWFAAKVFRVGILMYGKPPDLRTLVRWVRMA